MNGDDEFIIILLTGVDVVEEPRRLPKPPPADLVPSSEREARVFFYLYREMMKIEADFTSRGLRWPPWSAD
jgi:hypothetical protein